MPSQPDSKLLPPHSLKYSPPPPSLLSRSMFGGSLDEQESDVTDMLSEYHSISPPPPPPHPYHRQTCQEEDFLRTPFYHSKESHQFFTHTPSSPPLPALMHTGDTALVATMLEEEVAEQRDVFD